MSHTIYMAFAGLDSRAQALEVLANNLANAGAAGFKKDQIFFSLLDRLQGENLDPFETAINRPLIRANTGLDFSIGNLVQTGNPLDLALAGDGFFAIKTPQGIRYTRNGHFTLNERREVVTSAGFPVLSDADTPNNVRGIVLPQGKVEIGQGGEVSVDGIVSGKVKVVHFENLGQLNKEAAALFQAQPGAKEIPPATLFVRQGYLEQANVNPVQAMSEMIALMRSFESISQAIRSLSNNVDSKVINEVGKV